MTATASPRPKGLRLLGLALRSRKAGCMLGLGFSSGLPFALLIGSLNVWLVEVGIKLATIGVLSWIGLSYSFKFLWAPLVDRMRLPLLERLGRRRSWIVLCQVVLVAALVGLALTDPQGAIGPFAGIAFAAAFASATQDIAIDAWRIDVADEETSVDLLSAISQFGYRIAAIVGGALALFMAARMSWPHVFCVMAVLMGLAMAVTLFAPDTPRAAGNANAVTGGVGELAPLVRGGLLLVVLVAWGWAITRIALFMHAMLATPAPGQKLPSVAEFTRGQGVWIIGATVGVPLLAAFVVRGLTVRGLGLADAPLAGDKDGFAEHAYGALVAPLVELVERLGAGVLVLLGFILSYALCYNLWSSFAGPFYIGAMHYTKDQVAFASKIFGIIMTMIGISTGGYLFARIGRFPTVLIGAILPPLGNLLYADLADGGAGIDAFTHALRLDLLAGAMGADARMTRLLVAICYENIATGIALTAFVAYLSGIVSKRYTAIQYALLSSLTFLVGTLGRGVVGEAFDRYGYAPVFRITALAGLVSVSFVLLEWLRVSRSAAKI
jgi:PAT family beta-lactamase induction signal transducer AmpG